MKKRICSLLLAGLMALSSMGTVAVAEVGDLQSSLVSIETGGLCEHHTQHDESCGYTEGTPEQPCTHEHTEDCYVTAENCVHQHDQVCGGLEDPSACSHQCSQESGCVVRTLDCRHQHDQNCGYAPAVEGTPCTFVCETCNGQGDSEQEENPQPDGGECTCETLCAQGAVNPDCPLCGGEGADLTACKGKPAQEETPDPACLTQEENLDSQIQAEEVILDTDILTEEAEKRLEAGLEDNPELLTVEDVFAADPELAARAAAAPQTFARSAAERNPATYIVTEDNENNAGTGQPDGDLDIFLKREYAQHPIEATIYIPEGKMPTQNCYIAVRTFDVDWAGEGGVHDHYEYDKLFVNDVRVGTLTGLNNDWNTSYYEVPLSALREGKNTIRVEIWDCEGAENFADPPEDKLKPTPVIVTDGNRRVRANWAITIDWMQLICDGGSRENIQEYSISLTHVSTTGSTVQLSVQTELQATGGPYDTEYTITDDNGFILGAYHGSEVNGPEQFVITMPAGQPDGNYTITGFLKKPDGTILATDQIDFSVENGVPVLKPRLDYTLSPDSWTNGDVTITVAVADDLGYSNITIRDPEKTVSQNGEYQFEYSYVTPGGATKTDIYTLWVGNIDKTPPTLSCAPITVMEESDKDQLAAAIRVGITASDTQSGLEGEPSFTLADDFCQTPGTKTVNVTLADRAGNSTTGACTVTVQALPLTISEPEALKEAADSFNLGAQLSHTGPNEITETGFVWGVMQNPTLTINNGKAATSQAVQEKEGTISVTASGIVDGVNYYCRAYAVAGGKTYYSEQTLFGIGAKQYGTVTIQNNRDNTFTVSRTGTDGDQTVYYRTVNGSAVGGTHFTHQAGQVTIPAGQNSVTITISEGTANTAYTGKPATAYSNADRTYQVEIYRVDGGAVLGEQRFATRTMTTSQGVDRTIFEDKSVAIKSTNHGDYDEDGYLGWTNGEKGSDKEWVQISSLLTTPDYWRNLSGAQALYWVTFKAAETNDGYQHLQVTPGKNTQDTSFYFEKGVYKGAATPSSALYACKFEHGGDSQSGTYQSYRAPNDGTNSNWTETFGSWTPTLVESCIPLPAEQDYVTLSFGASGNGNDKWVTKEGLHHLRVYDTSEPQLVAVAPLDSSTYRVGDTFTISLIFDEIVDETNSCLTSGDTVQTSWGQARYAGGMNTNVLYFEGTVQEGATGQLTLTSLDCTGKIKDMCSTEGTSSAGTTGNAGGQVDNISPAVTISQTSLENGTASGKITASNYTSLQYTWSQSAQTPVSGWLSATSGGTVSTRQTSGKWYLHVWAYRSENGTSAYGTQEFDFGTPENPTSPLPTLTVTVDNTAWAQQRTIQLAYTPADAEITMTGPEGQSKRVSGNQTVTVNGAYTFTLESGDETVEQTALVSRIDREKPALVLTGAGDTGTLYNQLTLSATASDPLSGVKSVEYVFTDSATVPLEGWQSGADPVEGKYSFTYNPTETQQTTKYLHVRVTDFAGNSVTQTSEGYKVVKEPAAADLPAIQFNTRFTDWVKGPGELTWEVTDAGAGNWTVEADGILYSQAENPEGTGVLAAPGNGLYLVQVTDQNGGRDLAELVVNRIDAEPPVADVSVPGGWAQEKTIRVANITDDCSPQVDKTGNITGYSGSGIQSQEYKHREDGSWTEFTGSSFAVTQNGTYDIRLTDRVGNSVTYTVEVTGIDTAGPKVTLSEIPEGWQSEAEITLTALDEGSGVKTLETAFAETNTEIPADLTEQTLQSGKVTLKAPEGQWYLYYRVTDQVGNTTTGCSQRIQVDGTNPGLTVSGGQQGAQTVVFDVQAVFGLSGGAVTVTKPDGAEETVSGQSYTVTEPGSYTFAATSNSAGLSPVCVTKQVFQVSFAGQDQPVSQLVARDGRVVRPVKDPARTGYTFAGWQKGGMDYDFTDPVTQSFTLTAAWTLNPPTGLAIETTYGGSAGTSFTYDGKDLVFTAQPSHLAGVSYTYQWYDEAGNKMDGQTGESLTVTKASAGTYTYSCAVAAVDDDGLSSAEIRQWATVTLDKQPVSIPEGDGSSFVYNGQEQTYEIASDSRYTVTGNRQTDAGTHTVTVSLKDTANYQWKDGSEEDRSYNFVIAKAAVEFEVSENLLDYNQETQTARVTPQAEGLTLIPGDYTLRYEQNGREVTPRNVGSYDILVTLKNNSLKFAQGEETLVEKKVGTLTIREVEYPNAQTMAWPAAAPLTYGETLAESALTGQDLETGGSYAWKTPELIPTVDNPGCTVVFTPDDANYPPVEHMVPVDVTPKVLTIAGVTAQSRVYQPGNTAVTLTGGTLEGVVGQDKVTLDDTRAAGTLASPDAGENRQVTVTGYALAGAAGDNYTLTQPDYVRVDITKAQGTAALTMEGWTYGETPAAPQAASATNGVDNVTWRYTGTLANGQPYDSHQLPTDAGEYRVEATFAATENYLAVTKEAEFTVAKQPVSIPEGDGSSFVYNGQEQTYEIASDSRYTVTGNRQTDAGTHTVTVSLKDTANYQWKDGSEEDRSYTFLIEPRTITVTWMNLDMVYNGEAQAPQAASLMGVLEADRGMVAAQAEEKKEAGEYNVAARLTGTKAHNYTLRKDEVTFSIRPAPVTFVVENNSVLYDGQSHTAQVTARALGKEFNNFTVSYLGKDGQTTQAPVQAGEYSILVQITDGNYRHSLSATGAARQVGVLEIYEDKAPALHTITFRSGSEEVTGNLPVMPDSLAGSIFLLPEANGLSREGYEFSGWKYEGKVYQPGTEFIMPEAHVTFTAQWVESYDIGGSVVWEKESPQDTSEPAQDVLVELRRGSECVAHETTDQNGSFSFTHILPGVYNLVISSGDVIRTAKVELVDQDQELDEILLPRGMTNSVLEVKDGVPPLVVGNLDNLFTARTGEGSYTPVYTQGDRELVKEGGKVEIRMEAADAEPEPDSPLGQALDNALTQAFVPGLTLDLTMEKSLEKGDGTWLEETPITESDLLIEVVIPLNGSLQGCRGYRVLREHEGQVDEITTTENQWGEYFTLNGDSSVLTIYARRFSLYSILYTNAQPESGSSNDDTSDSPNLPVPTPTPALLQLLESAVPSVPKRTAQPDTTPEPFEEPETPAQTRPEDPGDPAAPSDGTWDGALEGKPFVLLNAICAVAAVLMAAMGKSRGKARLAALLCAAGTVVAALLGGGWHGLVFANIWTLPAVLLTLLAGWFAVRKGTADQ